MPVAPAFVHNGGMRRLLLALALCTAGAARADAIAEGAPAPGFTLRALNPEASGTPAVSLDDLVGPEAADGGARLVLLSFFASWCEPCRREMPYLQTLHARYRGQGLRVLSVAIDRDPPGITATKRLAAESRVTFPVLSDRFQILARRYLGEASPLPSVFLIGRDGTVLRVARGYGKAAPAFLLAEVQKGLGLAAGAARAGR